MADTTYKGLTVKFEGDTTDLSKALGSINSEMAAANRAGRQLGRALKVDPQGMTLLGQAVANATDKVDAQKRRVELLGAAHEKVSTQLQSNREAMRQMEEQGLQDTEAYKKLSDETERLGTAHDRLERDLATAEAALKGYREELARANTEAEMQQSLLAKFGDGAAKIGGALQTAGGAVSSVGDSLTRNVTAPMVAGATVAVKAATDLDTAYHSVTKTIEGTDEQFKALKDSAIEASRHQPVTADEILEIEALGGQLGYTVDEVEAFADTVSGLDIATDMGAEEAAMNLAQFSNVMGTAHDQTDRYGSTIVHLGNNMATTESQISNMAMRISGAGKQLGMSEADVLGVAAALSSVGIEAEAGGSAISTIMSNIDKVVASGSEGVKRYADDMGMSVDDFLTTMRTYPETFEGLADSYGLTVKELSKETVGAYDSLTTWAETAGMQADEFAQLWGTSPVEAMQRVFAGMEQASEEGSNLSLILDDLDITAIKQTDTMKRLAAASDILGKGVALANEGWEENSALTAEVANRNDSLASKFEVARNKATAIAYEVGEPLADALVDAIDAAEPLIEGIADLAEGFSSLDEEERTHVITMAALVAAAGPVLSIAGRGISLAGSIASGVGTTATTLARFRTALNATNPDVIAGYKSAGTLAEKLGATAGQSRLASAALGVGLAVAAGEAAAKLYGLAIGYDRHAESASKAAEGLSSFAGVMSQTEASATNLDLTFSSSGQSISGLRDKADDAFANITETIRTEMEESGFLTAEGVATIEENLQKAWDAADQTADAYSTRLRSLGSAIGQDLDAEGVVQAIADIDAAYEEGLAAAKGYYLETADLVQAQYETGSIDKAAYDQQMDAAKAHWDEQTQLLRDTRASQLEIVSQNTRAVSDETMATWAEAKQQAEGYKTDAAAFMQEFSGIVGGTAENGFNQLRTSMTNGFDAAWFAAQVATADGGGRLSDDAAIQMDLFLSTFDGLPSKLEDEGAETMRALASSVEAAGVDLGNTSEMSCQEIVDAIYAKAPQVQGASDTIAAKQRLADISGESYTWGSHLVGNMASGIYGNMSTLQGAVNTAAATISNKLGQSVAKEGPLHYTDVWGVHLVDNIATGIVRTTPRLARATAGAARAIEGSFEPNVGATASFELAASRRAAANKAERSERQAIQAAIAMAAGVTTTKNYYSMGDVSVAPDSAMARAMDTTYEEARRYFRMGVR